MLYSSGSSPNKVLGVIEERGNIEDLIIHHSDRTSNNIIMTTFAQIEKDCYLVFHKEFEDLKEYAVSHYQNFLLLQNSFPSMLGYLRMNLMDVNSFIK